MLNWKQNVSEDPAPFANSLTLHYVAGAHRCRRHSLHRNTIETSFDTTTHFRFLDLETVMIQNVL